MRPLFALALSALLSTAHAREASHPAADRDHQLNMLISRGDATAARAYYHDDFVLTTSSGKAKHKADMLADIGNVLLRLEVNQTHDVAVRVHGDTAVLTGILHQRGRHAGKPFDVRVRVTVTWVRADDGTWVILAGHASAL